MSTGRLGAGDTAIQPTILNAKGDLIAATAADTPAALTVGANDTVLTADSAEATGLEVGCPCCWWYDFAFYYYCSGSSTTISDQLQVLQAFILLRSIVHTHQVADFYLRMNGDSGRNYSRNCE
jgi:hypothetical protein